MTDRDLPDGWRWAKLGDVLEKPQPGFACGKRADDGLIQVRMHNISEDGSMSWAKITRIPSEFGDLAKHALVPGDILFNHTNSAELVGKSAVFTGHDEPVVFSNHFFRLRPRRDVLDGDYLARWLQYIRATGLFTRLCNRWIGQAAFTRPMLLNLDIAVGPVADQKLIVKRLDDQLVTVARAIEAADAQMTALEAMPTALLRKFFPRSRSAILNRGTRWVKLGDICEINPRRPSGFAIAPDEIVTFIPMSAVDDHKAAITGAIERPYHEVAKGYTFMREGDVIFAKITPCMQNGKHAIVSKTRGGFAFGSTEFHTLRPGPEITREWLHRYLLQPPVLSDAQRAFTGTAGQQRVPKEFLIHQEIALPPIEEQRDMMDHLLTQISAIERAQTALYSQTFNIAALTLATMRLTFANDRI